MTLRMSDDAKKAYIEGTQSGWDAAIEAAARFVESHEVGIHPRSGYIVGPSMLEGSQGTHAGMAYAQAIRAMKKGGASD